MSNEDFTPMTRDELLDLAHDLRIGKRRFTVEDVKSGEVIRAISSCRIEIRKPGSGLMLKCSRIISEHARAAIELSMN